MYTIDMYYDEVSWVCMKREKLRMLMESTNFLGLRIESGSGLLFWFEYLIYMHIYLMMI
jgi:hypothetical protein